MVGMPGKHDNYCRFFLNSLCRQTIEILEIVLFIFFKMGMSYFCHLIFVRVLPLLGLSTESSVDPVLSLLHYSCLDKNSLAQNII